MTESKNTSPKRSRWLRWMLGIAGILLILVVVVYFVATSSSFLKGVILPKVSQALGAEVTVAEATISPFSHLGLRDLKVQPPGGEPLLTVQEIHANYRLMSILGGTIAVSEVVIESPVLTVVQNADGTGNLDALTQSTAQATKPAPPTAAKSSKPPQVDIQKVSLNHASVRIVKNYANGAKDVTEVTGLNFTVTDLKNGQSGKIEIAAALAVQKAAQTNAAAASLSAKLMGGFEFALTPDLKPASAKGTTTFTVNAATGRLADLNTFAATINCELTATELKELALRCTRADALLAQIRVSGPFDAAKSEGKLKLEISGIDKQALNLAGAAGGLDFGTTTFNSTNDIELSQGGKRLDFQVNTHLDNLTTGTGSATVNLGNVQVQASGSVADMRRVKLDKYQVDVVRQGKPLVRLSGSATFDSATQDADLQVAMQTALAQLLAVPGTLPTDGAVGFNGQVTCRQKKIALAGELTLTPTERATNTLQLTGNVDIAQAGAITGSVKLTAASLDVTRYYNLLSSLKPSTNQPATAAAPTPTANPNQEPAALTLPLKNFTVDLNIGHFYLREVDVANWMTTVLVDGGRVLIKPCQLTLNGAPIRAATDLNLGVPGYTYDVTFDANTIPLAPLVASFAPDRKGQIAGTTTVGVQVKGAGVTGASLQKNLNGHVNFVATNLDLSIANVRSPLVNSVVNVIVGLPNLIRNPVAALGGLLGGTKSSGWADALTASPIEAIALQALASEGQVQLQSAEVRSAAFHALASGQITLAPVLTNSTIKIPVQVGLSRALAGQVGLMGADTPTNAVYVALPDFLQLAGTVGHPQTIIDKLALVKLAAQTGGGVIKGIGGAGVEKTESLLNAAGSLFGGGKSATNPPAPATTNGSPAASLLKLFK